MDFSRILLEKFSENIDDTTQTFANGQIKTSQRITKNNCHRLAVVYLPQFVSDQQRRHRVVVLLRLHIGPCAAKHNVCARVQWVDDSMRDDWMIR
jgi:hypothetical protein